MSALQNTIDRLHAAALPAAETRLAAMVESMLDDRDFENALRRTFGAGRGSELFRRGNAAVIGAAESLCERCVQLMAARHPTYDALEHLAAKALYRAARERMRARDERVHAVQIAAE